MTRATSSLLGTGILCVALASSMLSAQRPIPLPAARRHAACARKAAKPATPAAAPAAVRPAPAHRAHGTSARNRTRVIKRYCVGCHNEKRKDNSGGLALENFDVAKVAEHAPVGERMIRKLQAGMMPPPGARRPDAAGYAALINALEIAHRRRARRSSRTRPPDVPAAQSRRVRARGAKSCSASRSTPASGCRSTR